MTKNFLLAATAITAITVGGAANAGTFTFGGANGSKISAVDLVSTAATPAFAPYTIAAEATDPTATAVITASTTSFNVDLTNDITVAAGTTVSYVVKFTLDGPAKFGPIAAANLKFYNNAAAVTVSPQNTSPADGKTASYLVTIDNSAAGATALTITNVALEGVALSVSGEADVTLSSEVQQAAGGAFVTIDSTSATKIVQFKTALAGYVAAPQNVLAGLPDFKAFKAASSNPATLSNSISGTSLYRTATATGYSVALASAAGTAKGGFYADLSGTALLTVTDIVASATATVTGTNLDKLTPTLAGVSAAAGSTATSASFTLATPALATAGNFVLTEPTAAADRVALAAGAYSLSILPAYKSGFTSPATATAGLSLLNVTLDGTNFTAPWFTLTNPNNAATLRLANNGAAPTGPVFVELKAHNGSAAPTTARVQVAANLAPNGVFQITGPELATLFGTDAANGDLQVTVQGDGNVISGKVRVRNVSGATFEQSLRTLGGQ